MVTQRYNPGYGQPVRSLQALLRELSFYHSGIPPVIPDGIFGGQTRAAVLAFQQEFALPATGEVNNDTWDAVVTEYEALMRRESEPQPLLVFPSAGASIRPGESSLHLFTVQAAMYALSQLFPHLGAVSICGTHNEQSVTMTKKLQAIAGLEENGVIDRNLWDKLAGIYEEFVSRNRVQKQK